MPAPGSTVAEEVELTSTGHSGPGAPAGGWGGGGAGGARALPRRVYYTGLAVGLGAILMFFMALTSAYIVRKGAAGDWRAIELPRILWLNTLVLIASSLTIERARRQLFDHTRVEGFRRWWGITTLLGFLFLAGQLVAWRQLAAAGVYLASNPSSSFFYVLTAAHGLHLLGGLVALGAVADREPVRMTQGLAADLASIYWHFMDGLWVFLFLLLYLGR